jgi:hypothetical protein
VLAAGALIVLAFPFKTRTTAIDGMRIADSAVPGQSPVVATEAA